jgi:hypothetical protein
MTTGTIRTQGSELFFVTTIPESDPIVVKLSCPTGVSGVGGGAKDQLEDTCLDTVGDKTFKAGLGSPSPISVPFNFIPSSVSHQVLFELKRLGTVIPWLIALSDGAAIPTLNSDATMDPPALRTSADFLGYVSEVNIDIATNEIVRGTLTIQRSGLETWHFNAPAPTE